MEKTKAPGLSEQAGRKECLRRMARADLIKLLLQYETRVKSAGQISSFLDEFIIEFNARALPGSRILGG